VKRLEVSKKLKTNIKLDLDYKSDLKFFKYLSKKIKLKITNIETEKIIKVATNILS
jgi:spore coat polysaccharide biosynthesis protein SpsF (cytidylyltransferase family)